MKRFLTSAQLSSYSQVTQSICSSIPAATPPNTTRPRVQGSSRCCRQDLAEEGKTLALLYSFPATNGTFSFAKVRSNRPGPSSLRFFKVNQGFLFLLKIASKGLTFNRIGTLPHLKVKAVRSEHKIEMIKN